MIKIDVSGIIGLGEKFKEAGGVGLDEGVKQGLYIAGKAVQSAARDLVPVDTNALRLSISSNLGVSTSSFTQEIGPTQPYGKAIEFGRPPGTKVNPQALMAWAKKRGLNPYAVAKNIEKNGSPAQPYLYPAAEDQADNVQSILAQAVINAFEDAFTKS